MPDIAMCKQDTCEKKDTCYRYIATPNRHWQSYLWFDPRNRKDSEEYCPVYWDIKERTTE